MKILFVAPRRPVFHEVYKALAKLKGHSVSWYSGVFHDLYHSLKESKVHLYPVDTTNFEKYDIVDVALNEYDVAIIDQSHDPQDDWRLDYEGACRGTDIADVFNARGLVCIGITRDGKFRDQLLRAGYIEAIALDAAKQELPALVKEAARIAADNTADYSSAKPGMLALTLRQPWANACFLNGKDFENRNWPAKVRGTVAIHVAEEQPAGSFEAGARFIRNLLRSRMDFITKLGKYENMPRGAIIGVVDIIDCVEGGDSPWFEGPFGLKLANPRIIHSPIPCTGKRRFWKVPAAVEKQIRAQLAQTEAAVAAVTSTSGRRAKR